jgi:hypothetical protein
VALKRNQDAGDLAMSTIHLEQIVEKFFAKDLICPFPRSFAAVALITSRRCS